MHLAKPSPSPAHWVRCPAGLLARSDRRDAGPTGESSSCPTPKALAFGSQKIKLHKQGREFEPKAGQPTPGSADLCFLTDTPLSSILGHLSALREPILEGPVARTGAVGPIHSVDIRDPDGNLVEITVPERPKRSAFRRMTSLVGPGSIE